MKKIIPVLAIILLGTVVYAQRFSPRGLQYRDPETSWMMQQMEGLSIDEKIAQLMIVRVPLDMDDKATQSFSDQMNGLGVGGVCFFAGTAERQVVQTRLLQHDARIPLIVAIDGEWGLGMRLKDMYSFPRAARFGRLAPQMDSLVYRMGAEIGSQCREMGIHINFAPVVDINSNPKNPVIGTRSFGTDRERVAQLGIMYMQGQQSQGVLATAKHFPGHGDTDADSHLELPVIRHSRAYIDSVDTYPFRRLVKAGVGGVMVAHLQVNALDSVHPSSLSPMVIDTLLRQEMGFEGLVVTDGLDMKGVTNTYKDGSESLAALRAGNDLLLLPPDVPAAIAAIKKAASHDKHLRQLIDYRCERVLRAKYRLVMPHIGEEIRVPGKEHLAVCNDIVTQLNINTDMTIDSIVAEGIAAKAMPGCQILVMHKGKVLLERNYGSLTYDSTAAPVDSNTVYDLASLTKVCATTLAVMKLYDEGKLKLDDKLSRYLPYLKDTDKQNITIRQVMSHCAGLKPFDAFWQQAWGYDSILAAVAISPTTGNNKMCYSDLGFMLLSDVVRQVSGQPLDQYVAEQFYEPMGLVSTRFNPTVGDDGISVHEIAPTEVDTLRGLIRGQVHDPNANAMGGVSGHAGLFSTAREVAMLMQMVLNRGELDGYRYLSEHTVDVFTDRYYANNGNRRALGFDRVNLTPVKEAQYAAEVSASSFGHTGFTGTMVWVDPDYELVYVFLSNRVHPTATPNKLAAMNIRTRIQSCIYNDILK